MKSQTHTKFASPWINFILVGLMNLVGIIGILFVASQIGNAAAQLNLIRTQNIKFESDSGARASQSEVAKYKQEVEKLASLFPDDDKLLEFINEIELAKSQGLISSFAISSDQVVKDRTGLSGVPVAIELKGNREQLNTALAKIEKYPVIISPILLEVSKEPDNTYLYKFGGFLYVDETLN